MHFIATIKNVTVIINNAPCNYVLKIVMIHLVSCEMYTTNETLQKHNLKQYKSLCLEPIS